MSDEKVIARIVVSMTDRNNVSLEGIPESAVMAYGMLEIAKEMITTGRIMQRIGEQQKIVPAPPGWVPPRRPTG